jgi:hypothetical protein
MVAPTTKDDPTGAHVPAVIKIFRAIFVGRGQPFNDSLGLPGPFRGLEGHKAQQQQNNRIMVLKSGRASNPTGQLWRKGRGKVFQRIGPPRW